MSDHWHQCLYYKRISNLESVNRKKSDNNNNTYNNFNELIECALFKRAVVTSDEYVSNSQPGKQLQLVSLMDVADVFIPGRAAL